MVSLASLHRDRAVGLGDAGYCPTFLSGMGASLALLGAKALQRSVDRHPVDLTAALAEYDGLMRPVIGHYQQNARNNPELILNRNPLREIVEEWVMRLVPPAVVAGQLGRQHDLEASLLEGFGPLETVS
jgi:2-polyprenyl-6-methoxyphenol hydroxylase-like FAD-dependent oxidoreductase